MIVVLPFPPSWNSLYRVGAHGGLYMKKEGVDYQAAVQTILSASEEAVTFRDSLQEPQHYKVTITAFMPDNRVRDLANLEKILNDSVFKWLGLNDTNIHELRMIRRENIKEGQVIYEMSKFLNPVDVIPLAQARVGDTIRTKERDHVITEIRDGTFVTSVEETTQEVLLGFDFVKRNGKVLRVYQGRSKK